MKCINKRFVRVCSLLLVCSLCTISGTGCGENRLEDAFEADLPGIGIQTSEESSKIPYFASDLCVTDTDVQDIEADTEDALAACFFNLNEKKVLYAKNIHERMYPASTTKIMTALVALDKGDLDAQTTVSKEAITFSESGVSTAKLKEGDVLTLRQLLYALLTVSANDAANVIAEQIAGSQDAFVEMMNQEAQKIGATNTHFVNASGLPDPDHYSTAHDMALIMREGLKNKKFRRIIGTTDYTIKPTNMNSESRVLHTHHPMLAPESSYHYDGCIGGKTGYTSEAGNTLVTAAEKNGTTYITVTMKAADLAVASTDSTALFNYGYQNFTKAQVNGGEVSVPNGVTVDNLTVQENSQNGNTVDDYYYNDYLLGSVEVPEATPTPEPAADALSDTSGGNTDQADQNEKSDTVGEEKTSAGMPELRKILLIIGAAMLLLIIILSIALAKKEKRYYG